MSIDGDKASGNVMSFLGVLGLIFIVLKLTGVISWSWVIVLLPWGIPGLFIIFLMTVFGILHLFNFRN